MAVKPVVTLNDLKNELIEDIVKTYVNDKNVNKEKKSLLKKAFDKLSNLFTGDKKENKLNVDVLQKSIIFGAKKLSNVKLVLGNVNISPKAPKSIEELKNNIAEKLNSDPDVRNSIAETTMVVFKTAIEDVKKTIESRSKNLSGEEKQIIDDMIKNIDRLNKLDKASDIYKSTLKRVTNLLTSDNYINIYTNGVIQIYTKHTKKMLITKIVALVVFIIMFIAALFLVRKLLNINVKDIITFNKDKILESFRKLPLSKKIIVFALAFLMVVDIFVIAFMIGMSVSEFLNFRRWKKLAKEAGVK